MITDRTPRRLRPARTALAATALAALVGSLATAPAASAAPGDDMFCEVPGQELAIAPISSLEEGDDVTWLSTTKGTTPTTFTGEYIGKLDNALGYDARGQERDLLLVRLDGDLVNGTGAPGSVPAGVWAGASGSPVYDADGALIGAVSYGFAYGADNVAGVTPAAYMKTIGELPGIPPLGAAAQRQAAQLVADAPQTSAGSGLRPLEPVRVTMGATSKVVDQVTTKLGKKVAGFRGVTASGLAIDGGAASGADYPIVAGGNIAVSFAYGAVGEASVGTVTAVCGDQVFAYGHPNQANSKLTANFHGASAARVVPDITSSYKLVSAIGKVKGTITDDRLAGLRGTLGAGSDTIAVKTTSKVGSHTSKAVAHVSEKLLVASAAAAMVYTDAVRMLDNQWEGSAKVSWAIDYRREDGTLGTLRNINRYSDPTFFAEVAGWDVAENIAMLQANPFEDVTILEVRVVAAFDPDHRAARISGVQIRRSGAWQKIEPGSVTQVTRGKTYKFRTVLSPAPGAKRVTEYVRFDVRIPSIQKRSMTVRIGGLNSEVDYYEEFASFEEFIAALDDNLRSDKLERTRSYVDLKGSRRTITNRMTAPTVVVDDGRTVSFTLRAAPKK